MRDAIETVLGPVSVAAVGRVLVHEHLALDLRSPGDPEAILGEEDEDSVAKEMAELRAQRVGLVVELTNWGMGRDPNRLRRIAERSGVPVVAATGLYQRRFHPAASLAMDVDELAQHFSRELEEGIDGTGIRAGVIGEMGSSAEGLLPEEERALRAAARAAKRHDVAVITHAHLGRHGLHQLEVLLEEGMPADRIAIGHQDLLDDAEAHAAIAAAGAYVAYDTIGKSAYQAEEVRLRLIRQMVEWGFASRILLSEDISRRKYLKARGGHGYAYLFSHFLPRLEAEGISGEVLERILRENPVRLLAGGPADA